LRLVKFVGVKYAYATTGGITALRPAIGVGPGDEMVTTPRWRQLFFKTLNLDSASVESNYRYD